MAPVQSPHLRRAVSPRRSRRIERGGASTSASTSPSTRSSSRGSRISSSEANDNLQSPPIARRLRSSFFQTPSKGKGDTPVKSALPACATPRRSVVVLEKMRWDSPRKSSVGKGGGGEKVSEEKEDTEKEGTDDEKETAEMETIDEGEGEEGDTRDGEERGSELKKGHDGNGTKKSHDHNNSDEESDEQNDLDEKKDKRIGSDEKSEECDLDENRDERFGSDEYIDKRYDSNDERDERNGSDENTDERNDSNDIGDERNDSNDKGDERNDSNVKGDERNDSNDKGDERNDSNDKGDERNDSNDKGDERNDSNDKGDERNDSNDKGDERNDSNDKGDERNDSNDKGDERNDSNDKGDERNGSHENIDERNDSIEKSEEPNNSDEKIDSNEKGDEGNESDIKCDYRKNSDEKCAEQNDSIEECDDHNIVENPDEERDLNEGSDNQNNLDEKGEKSDKGNFCKEESFASEGEEEGFVSWLLEETSSDPLAFSEREIKTEPVEQVPQPHEGGMEEGTEEPATSTERVCTAEERKATVVAKFLEPLLKGDSEPSIRQSGPPARLSSEKLSAATSGDVGGKEEAGYVKTEDKSEKLSMDVESDFDTRVRAASREIAAIMDDESIASEPLGSVSTLAVRGDDESIDLDLLETASAVNSTGGDESNASELLRNVSRDIVSEEPPAPEEDSSSSCGGESDIIPRNLRLWLGRELSDLRSEFGLSVKFPERISGVGFRAHFQPRRSGVNVEGGEGNREESGTQEKRKRESNVAEESGQMAKARRLSDEARVSPVMERKDSPKRSSSKGSSSSYESDDTSEERMKELKKMKEDKDVSRSSKRRRRRNRMLRERGEKKKKSPKKATKAVKGEGKKKQKAEETLSASRKPSAKVKGGTARAAASKEEVRGQAASEAPQHQESLSPQDRMISAFSVCILGKGAKQRREAARQKKREQCTQASLSPQAPLCRKCKGPVAEDGRLSPSEAQAGPSQVQAGPSQVQAGPSQVQAGPSQVQPGPSQVQPGPSQVQAGPSQVQAGPSQVQPGPSQVQAGPETKKNRVVSPRQAKRQAARKHVSAPSGKWTVTPVHMGRPKGKRRRKPKAEVAPCKEEQESSVSPPQPEATKKPVVAVKPMSRQPVRSLEETIVVGSDSDSEGPNPFRAIFAARDRFRVELRDLLRMVQSSEDERDMLDPIDDLRPVQTREESSPTLDESVMEDAGEESDVLSLMSSDLEVNVEDVSEEERGEGRELPVIRLGESANCSDSERDMSDSLMVDVSVSGYGRVRGNEERDEAEVNVEEEEDQNVTIDVVSSGDSVDERDVDVKDEWEHADDNEDTVDLVEESDEEQRDTIETIVLDATQVDEHQEEEEEDSDDKEETEEETVSFDVDVEKKRKLSKSDEERSVEVEKGESRNKKKKKKQRVEVEEADGRDVYEKVKAEAEISVGEEREEERGEGEKKKKKCGEFTVTEMTGKGLKGRRDEDCGEKAKIRKRGFIVVKSLNEKVGRDKTKERNIGNFIVTDLKRSWNGKKTDEERAGGGGEGNVKGKKRKGGAEEENVKKRRKESENVGATAEQKAPQLRPGIRVLPLTKSVVFKNLHTATSEQVRAFIEEMLPSDKVYSFSIHSPTEVSIAFIAGADKEALQLNGQRYKGRKLSVYLEKHPPTIGSLGKTGAFPQLWSYDKWSTKKNVPSETKPKEPAAVPEKVSQSSKKYNLCIDGVSKTIPRDKVQSEVQRLLSSCPGVGCVNIYDTPKSGFYTVIVDIWGIESYKKALLVKNPCIDDHRVVILPIKLKREEKAIEGSGTPAANVSAKPSEQKKRKKNKKKRKERFIM